MSKHPEDPKEEKFLNKILKNKIERSFSMKDLNDAGMKALHNMDLKTLKQFYETEKKPSAEDDLSREVDNILAQAEDKLQSSDDDLFRGVPVGPTGRFFVSDRGFSDKKSENIAISRRKTFRFIFVKTSFLYGIK